MKTLNQNLNRREFQSLLCLSVIAVITGNNIHFPCDDPECPRCQFPQEELDSQQP